MVHSPDNPSEAFFAFFREHNLAVYRYHLLRSGDWQEAQAMTAETFRRAQRWFSHHQEHEIGGKVWLFRIAVGLYARFRRPPAAVGPAEGSAMPTQDQLSQFALVTDLSDRWHRLPRKQQDAIALVLFAGLEPHEAADVIGWGLDDLVERIKNYAADLYQLRALVDQISPVGYFMGWLENELRERSGKQKRSWFSLSRPGLWWLRYRAGPLFTVVGQFLPILVLGGLLFWGVDYLTDLTSPGQLIVDRPTATARPPRRVRPTRTEPAISFPNSDDQVLVVSRRGAVYKYGLSNQIYTRLTSDEFYSSGSQDPEFPPQVSPDGYWLALVNRQDGSTWLFSMDGAQRRQINADSLRLTWSPDGERVIYTKPQNARILYQFSLASGNETELMRLPGEVNALAWSPDGRNIGVVYQRPTATKGTVMTYLGLLDSEGSQRVVLAAFEEQPEVFTLDPEIAQYRLMWTDDSSELWFPHRMVAVDVDAGLVSELASSQSDLPVGKYANVPLYQLVAQPFADQYGIQQMLIQGATQPGPSYSGNPIAVSPDRSKVAMTFRNPNGIVGSLAVQQGPLFEGNLWIKNMGEIGKVSWTQEGDSLLVSEYEDRPGRIYRVIPNSGEYEVIDNNYWLLGTVSELTQKSRQRAPQTNKIQLSGPDLSGPKVGIGQSGLGFQLEVPAHWRVWQMSSDDPFGWMIITNFDFSDPLGFTSMGQDDIVIQGSRAYWIDQPVDDYLAQLVLDSQGEAEVEEIEIKDRKAYRLIVANPNGQTSKSIYIPDEQGVLYLTFTPDDSTREPVFDLIISSINFDQLAADGAGFKWENYRSPALGVSVDIPADFKRTTGCVVRESQNSLEVGSRVIITKGSLGGNSLRSYVNEAIKFMGFSIHLNRNETVTLDAGEAIVLEGSYSTVGLFILTYIKMDDEVFVVSYSPMGSCDMASGVSELQVYQRMVESLRSFQ